MIKARPATMTSPRSPLTPVDAPLGRTIAQRLADEPLCSESEIARLVRELLDALKPLHDAGECHGAITPWSICVDRDDRIRLYYCDQPAMADDARLFTAPEVAVGGEPTASADLYAVGMLGHVLAAGRVPEPEEEDPEDPSTYVPGLLGSLLRSLVDTDPERRPTHDEARATLAAPVLNRPTIC